MDKSFLKIESSDSEKSGSDTMEVVNIPDVESQEDSEDFVLPETVTLLTHDQTGCLVYLIGTAHFSKQSQEDVEKVIKHIKPHIVLLELCSQRINILTLSEAQILEEAKNIDMAKIISTVKQNGVLNGLMYLLLLNMSAYITKEIGLAPGGEFRVAFQEAYKLPGCDIRLADRPINITIRRALSKLTWFQTFKLAWHLISNKDPISVEEIETCKNRDMMEKLLADLAGEYPAFRQVFLDERDIYLTNSLQYAAKMSGKHLAEGQFPIRIVGVVGIGHTPGIIKLWPNEQQKFIPELMKVPPRSLTSKIIKISFKITLVGFGGYLIYKIVPIPNIIKINMHTLVEKLRK